jgi:hypothetical protein
MRSIAFAEVQLVATSPPEHGQPPSQMELNISESYQDRLMLYLAGLAGAAVKTTTSRSCLVRCGLRAVGSAG